MLSACGAFVLVAFTAVQTSILRGPDNVVGIVDGDVTLDCRTNASQKVEWTFRQFGETVAVDESKFPGHHRSFRTSDGRHSLTLERLTFYNAGRYVCRVVGMSEGGVDAAAAFVVVVADPPRCTKNITSRLAYNNSVSLECSVTFFGQHSLTLEWLAPDGEVIDEQQYPSGDLPYVARLPLSVKAEAIRGYNLSTVDYKCRASFSNGTTAFVDEASNPPEFRRNTCSVPLSALVVSPIDVSSQAASKTDRILVGLVPVIGLILLVIIIICLYRWRAKKNLEFRNLPLVRGNSGTPDNPNNEGCGQNAEAWQLMPCERDNDKRCGGEKAETGAPTPVAAEPQNEPGRLSEGQRH